MMGAVKAVLATLPGRRARPPPLGYVDTKGPQLAFFSSPRQHRPPRLASIAPGSDLDPAPPLPPAPSPGRCCDPPRQDNTLSLDYSPCVCGVPPPPLPRTGRPPLHSHSRTRPPPPLLDPKIYLVSPLVLYSSRRTTARTPFFGLFSPCSFFLFRLFIFP